MAGGYFWYFATVGLFVPFWPVYLDHRGFDALAIGLVMGVFAGMRVLGPPLYAHWADASPRPLALVRGALVAALACALVVPWLGGLAAVVVVLAAYSALWNGVMAVYDAHVLGRLGADTGRYGLLRLWGSIGFIAASLAAGPGLERGGIASLPWLWALLIALTWLSVLGLGPGAGTAVSRPAVPIGGALRDRRVRVFLVLSFLMLASHGAYYNFFSLYLERHGYGGTAIGAFWAWGVTAEIGIFLAAPRLVRLPLAGLMVVSLAAAALRWTLLAVWPDSAALVFVAQSLHLASFGLFHLCSVSLAQALFPHGAATRGQALHGSIGFGLGGMVGALASGWLWREVSPEAAFGVAAAVALAATVIAAAGLRGLPPAAGRFAQGWLARADVRTGPSTDTEVPRRGPQSKLRDVLPDFGK